MNNNPSDFTYRLLEDVKSIPLSRAKLLVHSDLSHTYLELYYQGKRIGAAIYVTADRTNVDGDYEIVYLSHGDAYTCLRTCVDDTLIEYFKNEPQQ